MIVYGDAQRRLPASVQIDVVRSCAADDGKVVSSDPLERARGLLIAAGCLEQAVSDATPAGDSMRAAELAGAITDAAAGRFHRAWARTQPDTLTDATAAAAPDDLMGDLDSLAALVGDRYVTVKEPEGFAFYALHPEQSMVAARAWAAANGGGLAEPVVVVGVRSIGTTLSAVVVEVLRGAGHSVRRVTVRPSGAPFARDTTLADEVVPAGPRPTGWYLVVDEGPGLSGSSMASVAAALERRGVPAARIAFLPGHGGGPGAMASTATLARWATTSMYVAPLTALRWNGASLVGVLSRRTEQLVPRAGAVMATDDLGAGGWRRVVVGDEERWPAVCVPFERTTYRCVLADGRAVLWRYAGVDSGRLDGVRRRAACGLGPPLLDVVHGFAATPWVDGDALGAPDLTADLVDRIGSLLHSVRGPQLTADDQLDAVRRLDEVLRVNTAEALGAGAADRAGAWTSEALAVAARSRSAAAGDGRPAPHGWIRDRSGRTWKVDGLTGTHDHTVVGTQSIAWDVAGTVVEWGLVGRLRHRLCDSLAAHHHELRDVGWVRFHELTYAAFRLGQTTMCAELTEHPAERARLLAAAARYRTALAERLGLVTAAAAPPTGRCG